MTPLKTPSPALSVSLQASRLAKLPCPDPYTFHLPNSQTTLQCYSLADADGESSRKLQNQVTDSIQEKPRKVARENMCQRKHKCFHSCLPTTSTGILKLLTTSSFLFNLHTKNSLLCATQPYPETLKLSSVTSVSHWPQVLVTDLLGTFSNHAPLPQPNCWSPVLNGSLSCDSSNSLLLSAT